MIILEGPDGTGKSTLAKQLSDLTQMDAIHFTKESKYEDFLAPLLDTSNEVIMDRCAWSEYPYSKTRRTDNIFRLSWKQFHNLTLLTMIRNPLIIMCVHHPQEYDEVILPREKWSECFRLYLEFFNLNGISPLFYDYSLGGVAWFWGFPKYPAAGISNINQMIEAHSQLVSEADWWKPMWNKGVGAIGSQHPKMLIIAERLGPSNKNNLPFETGPTGYMLSDAIQQAEIPLNSIAVTNMVKDVRGVTRAPNKQDIDLLELELTHLKPRGILLMGLVAKYCIPMLNTMKMKIPYFNIEHLGSIQHRGLTRQVLPMWIREFRRIWDYIEGRENY